MTKEFLIQTLIKDGYLKTPAIIDAFKKIDRTDFLSEDQKDFSYVNSALPIGHGQTISQPLTVAFMLELLEPKTGEKILDIGSGSGWNASLLAYIVGNSGKIIGIERIDELVEFGRQNAEKQKNTEMATVEIIHSDGSLGYKKESPYDKIISAATTKKIPENWKEQLKIGGIIVAPENHSIIRLKKRSSNDFEKKEYFGFTFVPLITN